MNHSRSKTAFALLLFLTLSSNGLAQVNLTICNKSSAVIDSVVIEIKKPVKFGPITVGSNKTVFINGDQANFHSFVPFYFSVFSPVLNTRMQWMKRGFVDTIYFFDHGLSTTNNKPKHPDEFWLYLNNSSSNKNDTISVCHNAIKKTKELTPRSILVFLDHQQLDTQKIIDVKLGQKIFKANLNHCNFNDWTTNNGSFNIYDDSILINPRKNAKLYEFIIDFYVEDDMSWKDINVKGKQIEKTYVNNNGRTIRVVFEHSRFIAAPEFEIKIGRKKHLINLKGKELDEETTYLQFSISKKKSCRSEIHSFRYAFN